MSERFYLSLLAVVFACLLALTPLTPEAASASSSAGANSATTADATKAEAARRALAEGTALLGRNRTDQALPLIESALRLFTEASDRSGLAAASGSLGDIYLRHGQYATAIEHFRRAAETFHAQKETANAALMFAKLGEAYYFAGDEQGARAAFARIGGTKESDMAGDRIVAGASGSGSSGAGSRRRENGAATFASVSASLPGLVSCLSFNPANERPSNPSDSASGNPSDNKAGNRPQNMGRAPKKLDDLGRMDLRVVDQDGNPVRGAKGRLSTTRPNGISCDCWEVTDAAGRAVLPPLHVGKVLKLEVNAPGYEPLEQIVPAERLAEPFKVTLQSKDALKSGQKLAHAPETRAGALNAPAASGACFDLHRLFIAYATSEFTLARADFNNNRLNSAQAHYRNVLAAADSGAPAGNLAAARLYRAVARTSLGDIALRQSRFAEALKFYEQAADIARKDGRAELAWSAERGLGKTHWLLAAATAAGDAQTGTKHRDAALRHYRAALDIIETLFAGSLRADNARSNFLATTKDVYDEASGVLAELALMNAPPAPTTTRSAAHAQAAAAAGRPLEGKLLAYAAEAFRIVERGKARSLLDMLGDAHAEVREGVPGALVERKVANMARQQEIANLLGGVAPRGDTSKQTVAGLEAELERLSVEFDSLENQIRTGSPRYAALVRAEPLTLAEVQRQVLDDSTVLLEYSLGAQQSYLFAATRDGLTLHRLPSRERIERQAIELRQQLIPAGVRRAIAGINVENTRGLTLGSPSTAPANVGAYKAASHALYRMVVAPAAASLGGRRLLVVAEGALNYVPFESLVTGTEGIDYSTLSYLVKTNEIVYAPSASVVGEIRRQAKRGGAAGRGGMLLVADPVFDEGDLRLQGSSQNAARARESVQRLSLVSALADVTNVRSGKLKLARLDGTRSEAEEIAKLTRAGGGQADVWLDFDANETNLRARKLDDYRFLHFATHGLLDAERPRFTGLALSLVGQAGADGFLRVDEVFNLRLGSPLVMLSACETGLGRERRGEGVIGLTRAFMYAGAPTVGVSLWSVGDKSTAELMPEFYRRLLAGQDGAPAAMRAAQLALIAGKRYSAPFYWSPFVIVGDWRSK
ncbi:MAG TPA: CHAT domain-containing protein [Pyrinomonadaceae bacterium]|nr:CHAT domain-containing protein [Pyrinomonadaceae bacterium]